jgi:hypothetical protein
MQVGLKHRSFCWVDVTDPAEQKRAADNRFIPVANVR